MAIFRRWPSPLTWRWMQIMGYEISRFSTNISLWDRWLVECRVSSTKFRPFSKFIIPSGRQSRRNATHQWIFTGVMYSVVSKLLWSKYVDDSKRRRLFYQSMSTPKRTEQNLIVRIGKCEAQVTNNKRLCSSYRTVEANYRQTRSIARPLCDSWASCVYSAGRSKMVQVAQQDLPGRLS